MDLFPAGCGRRRWLLLATATIGACAVPTRAPETDSSDWHELRLPGKRATSYTRGLCEGRPAWLAKADSSASLLRRRVQVGVTAQTTVEFSWWVAATIQNADLSDADTADSPVRVVFAFAGDVSRLSMRNRLQFQMAEALMGEAPPYATLMYVWDNRAEPESLLPGARSDRVQKIVVERGEANLRRWRTYRRSLTADFQRAFGEEPGMLVGIALLTDSDNTRSKAEAWYGDVLVHP
jgi:hypothetical protein